MPFEAELFFQAATAWKKNTSRSDSALTFGAKVTLFLIIFAVTFALLRLEIDIWPILLVLFGFLAGIAVWSITHKRQTKQIAHVAAQAHKDASPTTVTFTPQAITIQDLHTDVTTQWAAINDIIALPSGTALRIGASTVPNSDAALSSEMSPDAFRSQLEQWRSGK